jgi:hypothetical protein
MPSFYALVGSTLNDEHILITSSRGNLEARGLVNILVS